MIQTHATPSATPTWRALLHGRLDAALNMAIDEVLLESAARTPIPSLRFYGWTGRPASFGYFQKHAEVSAMTHLRPLVRRPTGGGLVPHEADWTYSIVIPNSHPWYLLRATESYQRVHEWILASLPGLGPRATLAPEAQPGPRSQCFSRAERSDVLVDGHKIAGAAQRRTRDGLLVQGSIQPPALDATPHAWREAMLRTGTHVWGIHWIRSELDAATIGRARECAEIKYGSKSYLERV